MGTAVGGEGRRMMAIRLRIVGRRMVALCAAKTKAEPGDVYLGDNAHHALSAKFLVDFDSEGLLVADPPFELGIVERMKAEEQKDEE